MFADSIYTLLNIYSNQQGSPQFWGIYIMKHGQERCTRF
jgi:hypothetical protein